MADRIGVTLCWLVVFAVALLLTVMLNPGEIP